MIRFTDRVDAGKRLGALLAGKHIERPIVLGIPRGGVPVAAEIARILNGDLGVVVARKLGAPGQPELAIGAVSSNGVAYINHRLAEEVGATDRYLAIEQARQVEEARRREAEFDGHRHPPVAGRTVVIVDDGIATGATAIAALRSQRWAGAARVILAVPVGPPETIEAMRQEADDVYCLSIEQDFFAIGQFYDNFNQVDDGEVRRILAESSARQHEVRRCAITVTRDGIRLAVQLAVPPCEMPVPCVVFVHGLGSGKDSPRNVVLAERLVDAGFATVLFDLSGHGESDKDPQGDEAFIDDVAAVYTWAQTQPGVDVRRLMLAGSSMGGVVAVEALRAGKLIPPPAAMVLRAPPVEPWSPGSVTMPVLVIVGDRDPLLPVVQLTVQSCPSARLSIIPGAGHLFEEPGALERLVDESMHFFESVR